MNLREVLRAAVDRGCRVEGVRRTGEVRVSHPSWVGWLTVNARRKDAPRKLEARVRKLA